jgi:transcriptional regulator with XRE-family HTH domain
MNNIVKSARKRLGMTQVELAAALDIDQGMISKMESGRLDISRRTELALEALIKRDRKRVYFLQRASSAGPIKIGCSIAPRKRKAEIEKQIGEPVVILLEINGGFGLERQFHQKHKDAHQGGEWFAPTDELIADIEMLKSGEFNFDELPESIRLQEFFGLGRRRGVASAL